MFVLRADDLEVGTKCNGRKRTQQASIRRLERISKLLYIGEKTNKTMVDEQTERACKWANQQQTHFSPWPMSLSTSLGCRWWWCEDELSEPRLDPA